MADVKGEIYEAVEDDEIEDILQTAKNDRDKNIIGIKAYEEIKRKLTTRSQIRLSLLSGKTIKRF